MCVVDSESLKLKQRVAWRGEVDGGVCLCGEGERARRLCWRGFVLDKKKTNNFQAALSSRDEPMVFIVLIYIECIHLFIDPHFGFF